MPAPDPALVATSPWSTYRTSRSTRNAGYSAASWAVRPQWVVALRPSSSPAWARTKAPVQMETIRAPRAWAARSAARTSPATGEPGGCQPGTTTVSARSSASRPSSTSSGAPRVVGTGPGARVHSRKS